MSDMSPPVGAAFPRPGEPQFLLWKEHKLRATIEAVLGLPPRPLTELAPSPIPCQIFPTQVYRTGRGDSRSFLGRGTSWMVKHRVRPQALL